MCIPTTATSTRQPSPTSLLAVLACESIEAGALSLHGIWWDNAGATTSPNVVSAVLVGQALATSSTVAAGRACRSAGGEQAVPASSAVGKRAHGAT